MFDTMIEDTLKKNKYVPGGDKPLDEFFARLYEAIETQRVDKVYEFCTRMAQSYTDAAE